MSETQIRVTSTVRKTIVSGVVENAPKIASENYEYDPTDIRAVYHADPQGVWLLKSLTIKGSYMLANGEITPTFTFGQFEPYLTEAPAWAQQWANSRVIELNS